MGQLERYGLYVLCLVIFLILGVAIWGGDGEPVNAGGRAALRNGNGGKTEVAENNGKPLPSDDERLDDFENYLRERENKAARAHKVAADMFQNADTPNADDQGSGKGNRATPPPDVTPKPARKVLRTHVVADGETLGSIAQRYLGNAGLWHKILAINSGVSERNLKLGTALKIPERPTMSPSKKSPNKTATVRTYKVRKNDSPWSIACKHYGLKNASKYTDAIMKLNNIANARDIREGTILKLPPR